MFEHLKHLKNYEPGRPIEEVVAQYGIPPEKIIKLASNENPYGPAPQVIEAVQQNLFRMNRYPDDSYHQLKGGLAQRFGVKEENIIIGAGSDQILEMAVYGVRPKKILTAGITFAMYEIFGKQVGAEIIKTPDKTHNLEQFRELYRKHKPELIFICTPNNPLGEALDRGEVEKFIDEVDPETLIVIDGAYQEFAGFKDRGKIIPPNTLIDRPNLLYTGTFSKAYGLGGMRVGYGIANREIISNLNKLRPPFNITTLSLTAATTALNHWEWVAMGLQLNFAQMERYQKLAEELGVEYIDSYTNFLLLYFPQLPRTFPIPFGEGSYRPGYE